MKLLLPATLVLATLLISPRPPARAQQPAGPPAQQTTATREVDPNLPKDPIVAQELNLWRTYGNRDFPALKALLLPDYLSVADAIHTRDQVLAIIPTCTLDRFSLDTPEIRNLTHDSALIAYRFTYTLTCGQTQLQRNTNASTVWVRRNNQWLAQLHTETPVEAPPPAK